MNCIYFLCPDEQSIFKHELDNNHDTEYRDENIFKNWKVLNRKIMTAFWKNNKLFRWKYILSQYYLLKNKFWFGPNISLNPLLITKKEFRWSAAVHQCYIIVKTNVWRWPTWWRLHNFQNLHSSLLYNTSPWRPLISLGKQTHGNDIISIKDWYVRIYLCKKRLSMKSSRYETIVDLWSYFVQTNVSCGASSSFILWNRIQQTLIETDFKLIEAIWKDCNYILVHCALFS